MTVVRLAISGLGNIGHFHAGYLVAHAAPAGRLVAACDSGAQKRAAAESKYGIATFASHRELLAANCCDALLIATPHSTHVPILLDALAAGVHVLVEKPLAPTLSAARRAIEAARHHPHLKFAMMFNQRANPIYQKVRGLISAGELGHLTRITWIVTNWFRPHIYYASSPRRAHWANEGGGVLINQCPHNLDLLYWMTGMQPCRVTAIAFTGKTHPIAVEDEVSAILEYPPAAPGTPAAIGHFITSTGEAPGTNRLEIAGTRGKVVVENNTLTLDQTAMDTMEFSRTTKEPFGAPAVTRSTIEFPSLAAAPGAAGAAGADGSGVPEHALITQDFCQAILNHSPNERLLAPGEEAIHSLELGNAMLMAGLTRESVTLPLDAEKFDAFLSKMTAKGFKINSALA